MHPWMGQSLLSKLEEAQLGKKARLEGYRNRSRHLAEAMRQYGGTSSRRGVVADFSIERLQREQEQETIRVETARRIADDDRLFENANKCWNFFRRR